jgi:hypothetical protein
MPEIHLNLRLGRVARTYPAWLEWPRWLVPYRFRAVHHWWADVAQFGWLPCPLCDQPFGGHEWRDIDGKPSVVPDPTNPPPDGRRPFAWKGICPKCTRAGGGVR